MVEPQTLIGMRATFVAARVLGWKVVSVLLFPEFAASGQECHAAGCRQYSRTDDLFQTGGMFGTAND